MPQAQQLSPPPRPPERYWQDSSWSVENIQFLTAQYPDEWVAIFEKRVVAHSNDLNQVLNEVEAHGLKSPVIKFIERGIRVYNHSAKVSDEL